jgi:DNA-damage-inducible protein J
MDERTKQQATKAPGRMGFSVSDAVCLLLVRMATEKTLPSDVKVPNAENIKAMRAADIVRNLILPDLPDDRLPDARMVG